MFFSKKESADNDPPIDSSLPEIDGKPAPLPSFAKPRFPGMKKSLDLTSGSIPRNLLILAWPVIIGSSLNMLGPTIDVMWVGKLGSTSVAAVGVAGIAVQLLMASMMGLATGMRALIARAFGAGNIEEANHIAKQAYLASVFISLLIAIIGFFTAEWILAILGLDADVISQGALYLRIVFVSSVVMLLRFMMEGSLQAAGDTLRPMYITVIFRAIHIALCPFLIFGIGFFPEMGVAGAAVTNLISQTLGLILLGRLLLSGRTLLRFNLKGIGVDFGIIWRIIRVGIPASIMGLQMGFGAFVLIRFLAPFGTMAVAAHTIWQRVDMFFMMPLAGVGMAAGVMVGQNLGAHKPERADKSAWYAVLIGEIFMIFWVVVILFGAEWIVRLFNNEPGLVEIGAAFLRIASVAYLILSLPLVMQNCIAGAGDTVPPMILSGISIWLLQIPLAYFMSQIDSLGVYGIRWAIVISIYMMSIFLLGYFLKGKWKTKKI